MNKTQLLFLVILIEGYAVLATELLAIRSLVPFVGSGTEVVSIIISAVLMPLAFGYHIGGNAFKKAYAKSKHKKKEKLSIRKLLLKNVVSSLIVLTIGLSYVFQEIFFSVLEKVGFTNRLFQTSLYSVLFLSFPVFLLGQTVPLVSNYFSREKLSEITGKMLFFSTTGSFLGSVFSTIVLMSYVGVHNTVIVTISLLCILILLLVRSIFSFETILCVIVFLTVYGLNKTETMREFDIYSNNAYNMVRVEDVPEEERKVLHINRSTSSQISKDHKYRFEYFAYAEDNIIKPATEIAKKPLDILVVGAGGFAIGIDDKTNNYTFVDIDPDLKDVSEKYFLNRKLTDNKKFIASSARAFVHNTKNKYDIIFIDVYTNRISIPMECTTREFLLDVKARLKKGGTIAANVIASPTFANRFSVRYNNTFASVFPTFSRQIMQNDTLEAKKRVDDKPANIMYIYFDNEYTDDKDLYTDDKNTYSVDQPYN
ncbi:MAG: fused MFS/spermidine synthase [Rickettsiales bacterium]